MEWLGSILLALCGVPQAYKSIRQGHSRGISALFLAMWGTGEALLLLYTMQIGETALVINYWANLIVVGVILWFRLYPREP